jgi:hypothetical protein
MSVELVSRTEMAFYFPDSKLRSERLAGLVKSLIATKELSGRKYSPDIRRLA